LLYTGRASDSHNPMPDFPLRNQELKRKGMKKILLWQEYQQDAGENAYGYPPRYLTLFQAPRDLPPVLDTAIS